MPAEKRLKQDRVKENRELQSQLEIKRNDHAEVERRYIELSKQLDSIRAAINMPELYLNERWCVIGYSQNFLAITEMANDFANRREHLSNFLGEGDFEKLLEYEQGITALENLQYERGKQWRLCYQGPNDTEVIGGDWVVSQHCNKDRWRIENGVLYHEPHIMDRRDCYLMTAGEYGGASEDLKVVYKVRTSAKSENIRDMSLVICGSSGRSDALCDRIGYTACTASEGNKIARLQRRIVDITSIPESLELDTEYLITVEKIGGRVTRYLKNLNTGDELTPLQMIDSQAFHSSQNHVGLQTFAGELTIESLEIYTRKSGFALDQFRIPFEKEVMIRDEKLAGRIFKLHRSRYIERGKAKYTLIFEDITDRKNDEKNLIMERAKLRLSLKHEKLLSQLAAKLNSSEAFQLILNDILYYLANTLGFSCVAYYTLENQDETIDFRMLACQCEDGGNMSCGKEMSLDKSGWLWEQLRDCRGLIEMDRERSLQQGYIHPTPDSPEKIVMLPFSVDNKVIGFIAFLSQQQRSVNSKDENLLNTISDIFVNTIKRDLDVQGRIEAEKKQAESLRMVEKAAHMASIGVMAAGLTHEINQPLSSIKVTADSVLYWEKRNKGALPSLFVRKLEKISREVERIDNIVRHMRSFWISTERLDSMPVSLNEGVNGALLVIEQQLHAHEISCITSLARDELPVHANRVHLEQILINLIVNAMHSLDTLPDKEDKQIRISTFQENNSACMEVTDNGTGIPEGSEKVIFDPFFTTKKDGEGSGLGLAIVKRFVEEHRGSIEAGNGPEGGARFIVKFPLLEGVKLDEYEYTVGR